MISLVSLTGLSEILNVSESTIYWYLKAVKTYCEELNITVLGTHGLRHSTSELYMSHGATRDDLRALFAHSSLEVTERYLHGKDTNLERVTNVIQLFKKESDPDSGCRRNR